MKVSNLTLNIAWRIGSDRVLLNDFYKDAEAHHYIDFIHQNFLYTYPAFGTTYPGGKYSQFHRVTTCCHICGYEPERNCGGYGGLYLQRTGPGKRMNLVCDDHVTGSDFARRNYSPTQLSLF